MFGSEAEKVALAVTLTLVSGERLQGNLLLTRTQKLHEVLNRPEQFLEFATRDGRIMVIGKSSIASAATMEMPRTDQLTIPTDANDPHKMLEVGRDATQAAVRSAYHSKARLYHPDQFANHPLPREVTEYLNAMFIHVQAAYEELSLRPGDAVNHSNTG